MEPIDSTYYIVTLLKSGVQNCRKRRTVAEPEFRPFNLSALTRSSATRRPKDQIREAEHCRACRPLPVYGPTILRANFQRTE